MNFTCLKTARSHTEQLGNVYNTAVLHDLHTLTLFQWILFLKSHIIICQPLDMAFKMEGFLLRPEHCLL
jgi:hypothetical protein